MENRASNPIGMNVAAPSPGSTAVPAYLPLGFIAAGLVGFLILLAQLAWALPSSALFVRHNTQLLVLVHLFTLTWGSGVTLGVLHQMAPVIVSARLHSVPLGWFSLAFFVPGSLLLSLSFRTFWLEGVIAGGVFVIVGALLFAYNIARTLQASTQRDVTHRYITASVVSFIATLVVGIAMAVSLRYGAGVNELESLLTAHLVLGPVGWFTGIIMGAAYRLVSMFLLVHGHPEGRPAWIFRLLYGGIALAIVGAYVGQAYVLPGVLFIFAGIMLYGFDVSLLWKARGRRPDIWVRQVPWAVGYAVVSGVVLVGVTVASLRPGGVPNRIVLAFGLLVALGWVSTMILALLHKIVPFLVWYHRYSETVGRVAVPAMSDLTNERVGRIAFPIYHGTLLLTLGAIVVGATPLAIAAALLFAAACCALMFDLALLILPQRSKREV